jgi:glucose-1-phosphate thymidylyltransferase
LKKKPKNPISNYAIVGLYFYTNDVVKIAKNVKPSNRNELEITSINQTYLKQKKINLEILGRGFAWLDTGTHDTLLKASQLVETIEKRQGLKIACLEEIAFTKEYINQIQLKKLASPLVENSYGKYLLNLIK